MNKLMMSAAIVATLLAALYFPQLPACVSAYSAKYGRVVDASTGEGIPGAFVIAASQFHASNLLNGARHEHPYRMLTRTDAHGDYEFPSTWEHARFGIPGIGAMTSWSITVFKPPYTMVGDETWWASTRSMRGLRPHSVDSPPPSHWAGLAQEVEPIRMQSTQLSFAIAAYYYTELTWVGYDLTKRFAPDEIALRLMGNKFLRPTVCGLPPEQRVEGGNSMASFVYGSLKFTEMLRLIDSDYSPVAAEPDHRNPSARALCEVMGVGWATP
jgi:hypothetical protein